MKCNPRKSSFILLLAIILGLSCSDEGPTSTIQFIARETMVSEDDAQGKSVTIRHSAPAATSGFITVAFDISAGYGKDFTTLPEAKGNSITLPVQPGQLESSFIVMPLPEPSCRERFVKFSIQSVSKGMQRGNSSTFYLSIKNSDWNIVDFIKPKDYINEKDTLGIQVRIEFSRPASAKGSLVVYHDSYFSREVVYGKNFYTHPEMVNDSYGSSYVSLNYPEGARGVDFTVFPIYDEVKKPDVQVNFYVPKFGLDPCLVMSSNVSVFTLVITED